MQRVFSIENYKVYKAKDRLGLCNLNYKYITKLTNKVEDGWFTDIFDVYNKKSYKYDVTISDIKCIIVWDLDDYEQKLYSIKSGRMVG